MTQQINLYQAQLRPRRELLTARQAGVVTGAILLGVTLLAVATKINAVRQADAAAEAQKRLAQAQQSLTALTTKNAAGISVALEAELKSARAALAARKDVMGVLDSGQLRKSAGFSALMAGFARRVQKDLWLTGFTVSAGGEEIEIRGRALDAAALPRYMQALGREPVFQGRRFAALEMRSVEVAKPRSETLVGAAVAAEPTAGAKAVAAPTLRLAEFVLRSENAGAGADAAARGEARR